MKNTIDSYSLEIVKDFCIQGHPKSTANKSVRGKRKLIAHQTVHTPTWHLSVFPVNSFQDHYSFANALLGNGIIILLGLRWWHLDV